MKKICMGLIAIGAIMVTGCNSRGNQNENEHDMKNMDTTQHAAVKEDNDVKAIAVAYKNVDAKAAASLKEIVDHYLHIKNAMVKDDGNEAANGAKAMEEAVSKLDKSLLTAEQKAAYDKNEGELKTQSARIAGNGADIKKQREYFSPLSVAVYNLSKTFGGGRTVYHEHCPMARDNQGAMWISETKEIKNPYFGAAMLTCGSVEEVIN